MFFRVIPNPHKAGKLTRTMTFEAGPDQTIAIDAEQLHKTPKLLDALQARSSWIISSLDLVAYLILAGSLILSFTSVPWLWVPGIAICVAILQLVQRSAGSRAKRAAMQSNAAFFYLHSIGALWIVHAAAGV